MASLANSGSDPVTLLTDCLRERSGGTMIASMRDVWHMAKSRGLTLTWHQAVEAIADDGNFRIVSNSGQPMMVRPLAGG